MLHKYETYKEAEVDLMNPIPSHWQVKRLKDISTVISKGTTPTTEGAGFTDFGVRFLKAENINENGSINETPLVFISEETDKLLSRSRLRDSDLLIVIAGATTGKIAILPKELLPANTNQAVCFIRLHKYEQGRFLKYKQYALSSPYFQRLVWLYAVTSAQPNLPMAVLSRMHLHYPPLEEQTAIAQYLDTKTQAIDKKVSLLEKKIGYYQELRKSLINETVTKGMDKNVKLKESGIDWIGQIPEHWEVKRFKSFASTSKGKNIETLDLPFDNALPLLSLEYLRNENVKFDTYAYSPDRNMLASEKDLIIVWDGAAVGEILKAKTGFISSTIAKINFTKSVSSRFFYFLKDSLEYTLKSIPTGMGIPHLNPTILSNYPCPIPPLHEQIEIAEYLENKVGLIEKIITNIQTLITTLKELRKTLINDVVTGKIKVTK